MAIRYVKDFEFPSAAGYTKSAPSKVTGQMMAKGGPAKGIMVMIGIGKPAKGPLKKAAGSEKSEFTNQGYDRDRLNEMMEDIAATSEAERIMTKPKAPAPAKKPAPAAKKGSPYIPGTNIKPDPEYMKGLEEGARTPVYKKGGIAEHDDEAMDKALIKKMVKPSMLKKAKGGACYAEGGMAAAPQSPLQRMGMSPRQPSMASAKNVPVASRAPVIAPPSMGQRGIGVNAKRPGGPDVGALRAAMAKRVSQAMPDNAPAMMKKGGKVK